MAQLIPLGAEQGRVCEMFINLYYVYLLTYIKDVALPSSKRIEILSGLQRAGREAP